jgi:hypothetical protein
MTSVCRSVQSMRIPEVKGVDKSCQYTLSI